MASNNKSRLINERTDCQTNDNGDDGTHDGRQCAHGGLLNARRINLELRREGTTQKWRMRDISLSISRHVCF